MKTIKLTKNQQTFVDDEMFEELNKFKWFARSSTKDGLYYAVRRIGKNELLPFVFGTQITMHKYIMYIKNYELVDRVVDHINGDRLDNQYKNLRLATLNQNQYNSRKRRNNTSGYKGVFYNKRSNKWQATITINRKQIYLGIFSKKDEAAKAYDEASIKYHGEFANLNFPKKTKIETPREKKNAGPLRT